jgi:hypothetical protein
MTWNRLFCRDLEKKLVTGNQPIEKAKLVILDTNNEVKTKI